MAVSRGGLIASFNFVTFAIRHSGQNAVCGMWHMCETEREGDRAISAVAFEKSTHTLLGQDHTEGLSHGDYSAYC